MADVILVGVVAPRALRDAHAIEEVRGEADRVAGRALVGCRADARAAAGLAVVAVGAPAAVVVGALGVRVRRRGRRGDALALAWNCDVHGSAMMCVCASKFVAKRETAF